MMGVVLIVIVVITLYVVINFETLGNKYVFFKLRNFEYSKDECIGKIFIKGIYYTVKYVNDKEISIGGRLYPIDILELSYNQIINRINDNEMSFYEKLFQIIAMQD